MSENRNTNERDDMKPNHRDGAKWKGEHDGRIYTMATKKGERGFYRKGAGFDGKKFEQHGNLPIIFNVGNGYKFIGGGKNLTAKELIAQLEAQIKEASEKQERENARQKITAEYRDSQIKDRDARISELRTMLDDQRQKTEKATLAHRNANASIVAMKRQIELMGEALKVSQSAVVA